LYTGEGQHWLYVLGLSRSVQFIHIHRNLGFRRFIERAAPEEWFAAWHVVGGSLRATAIKARLRPGS
jgi:hypothetical protein